MDEIYWADFRPAAVDIGGTMHDLKPPPLPDAENNF